MFDNCKSSRAVVQSAVCLHCFIVSYFLFDLLIIKILYTEIDSQFDVVRKFVSGVWGSSTNSVQWVDQTFI